MKRLIFFFFTVCISLSAIAQNEEGENYKIFFFENGNKSSEGYLVDNNPDGYWKSYYENGNIRSEGNRINFLLDGLWKFYSEDGKLNLSIEYLQGKKNGERITYNYDFIISELLKNDVKEGITYEFDYEGHILSSINYKNGLEDGWKKEFDTTGRIYRLVRYKNGYIIDNELVNRIDNNNLKQGKWIQFYSNDNIEKEEFYVNDKLTGYCKYYDINGNLTDVYKYENGERVDYSPETNIVEVRKDYYKNGQVKIEACYRNNISEGVRREYDSLGNITTSFIFEKGKITGEGIIDEQLNKHGHWKEYYTDGVMRAEGNYSLDKKVGKWTYYHKNGKIEQEGSYDDDGLYTGTWFWYYPTGEMLREENFDKGKENGICMEYSEDGNVILQGNYIDGLEDGLWSFSVNNIIEKGNYTAGKKEGEWITKNAENIILKKDNYISDNPDGKQYKYYESGKIKIISQYVNGQEDGEWIYFSEDGEIYLTVLYSAGKEIKYDNVKLKSID
ncbi:MAG: hypothetical protein PHR20_02145 [Bacteroidales bacterium]|nr:hypothetical protein [Bacteroidales bacterium]